MNGPSSLPQPSQNGGIMPKKTKVEAKSQWTPEQRKNGEAIIQYIEKNIDVNVVANTHLQAAMAGVALGIIARNQTFSNLDPKIQSYLEYKWKETARTEIAEKDELRVLREAEWEQQFNNDESFRHGMTHPEDGARRDNLSDH